MTDDADTVTVGLLGLHSSKESKAILNAADALGHDTEWLRRSNTAINIQDGDLTLEPVVDVVVGVGGTQHTVTASVEDRSHMDYPLLLGRDILEHYHVDVTKQSGDGGGEREE
jgi:hypothetical protein